MAKPKWYTGSAWGHTFNEGVDYAYFYIPSDATGRKMYRVKVNDDTRDLIMLLESFMEQVLRPKWYQRLWRKVVKPEYDWAPLENAMRGDAPAPDGEPRSSIVEPKQETPSERAKREQDELLERLNP